MLKICGHCKIEKSLLDFYENRFSKGGYEGVCKQCKKKYRKIYEDNNRFEISTRHAVYYKKNKKRIDDKEKERRKNNKEEIRNKQKEYRGNNKERIRLKEKEYRENNKEKRELQIKRWRESEKGKEAARKYNQKKRSTPEGRINNNITTNIYQSLKGNKHGRHWEDLVGYMLQQLMNHLESQFESWMNWNNYGYPKNGERTWSIDHIKPISSFNFDSYNDEEFKQCWSLENLRPLCLIENIKKSNNVEDVKRNEYRVFG